MQLGEQLGEQLGWRPRAQPQPQPQEQPQPQPQEQLPEQLQVQPQPQQLLAQLQVQLQVRPQVQPQALPWEQPECQGFVFRLFLTFDNSFVVGGLLNFLSLIEVPVVGLGSPVLGPELDNVGVGHLGVGFSEVDVHFRKPNPKMPNPYVVKFW